MVDDRREPDFVTDFAGRNYEDLASIPEPKIPDAVLREREEQQREREDLIYPYESHWQHIDEIVNPERQAKGLDPIDRETADILCRMIVNFQVRLYETARDDRDGSGSGYIGVVRKYYKEPPP